MIGFKEKIQVIILFVIFSFMFGSCAVLRHQVIAAYNYILFLVCFIYICVTHDVFCYCLFIILPRYCPTFN